MKKSNGDESKAREFVSALYKNVAVIDSAARGSTTTFARRGIGDAYICLENEVWLAKREFSSDGLEIVVPSISILAEPEVAIVDEVVDKHGTRAVAEACGHPPPLE